MGSIILAINPGIYIIIIWIIIVILISYFGFRLGTWLWNRRNKKNKDKK